MGSPANAPHLPRTAKTLFAVLVGTAVLVLPTPAGLPVAGHRALAVFVLCVILWVTHAIPLMITSLLAIVLFPLLGILESEEIYPFFANPAVLFILGAFILASAVMRSGLSSRIALKVVDRFGGSPRSLLASVMLVPALMSFVMPEHAVAAMFFPIVLEISSGLELTPGESRYGKALFLAMAWGAIIGGIATFLGGARAPLALGILGTVSGGYISFLDWMLAALPTVVVMLLVGFVVLTRAFPAEIDSVRPAREAIERRIEGLGPVSKRELAVGALMLATIGTWIGFGEELGLANIALAAVALAFVFGLMRWEEVEEDVNWGVFLMYGGAIALGFGLNETGAARWLVDMAVDSVPTGGLVVIAVLALATMLLTEAMSNSAVVAMLLPIALGLSASYGLSPEVLTLGVAIPSGLAFMMPMGTPATAIAYSSGHLRPRDTIPAGLLMLTAGWLTFMFFAVTWWPIIGFEI